MADQNHTPCIIESQGDPIGYLPFYPREEEGVWGIDQFIGIPEQWSRGLGTRIVRLILNYLFDVKQATKCVFDPQASNHRAVRSYEKAGFEKVHLMARHEWTRANFAIAG